MWKTFIIFVDNIDLYRTRIKDDTGPLANIRQIILQQNMKTRMKNNIHKSTALQIRWTGKQTLTMCN